MRITVRLFAALRERAGWSKRELDLPDGAVVADVWPALDLGDERPDRRRIGPVLAQSPRESSGRLGGVEHDAEVACGVGDLAPQRLGRALPRAPATAAASSCEVGT